MTSDGRFYRHHYRLDDPSGGGWDPTVDATPAFDAPLPAGAPLQSAAITPQPSHGTALSPTTPGLSMVEFMTGLDSSGNLDSADPNYWNWNNNNPPTYNPSHDGHVWGASGVTVTYWFDPSSNWTATEKAAFTDALNLWSGVANIHFTLSSASSNPGDAIDITRGTNGQANTNDNYTFSFPDQTNIVSSATVSIDTSVGAWSQLGSVSNVGG